MSTSLVSPAVLEARESFLELGGGAELASRLERLAELPAFRLMASASLAARPQWAGLVDDLFERPLLKHARKGLRNAFTSTFTGDTLYRNVFFSFADAVMLWHYGYTQERSGSSRLDRVYDVMLRLLAWGSQFAQRPTPTSVPDLAAFQQLRRIALTRDNAYPLLRRAGRLIGAVEANVTEEKLHPVRGSILTSYFSFSAQVIAMSRAVREQRPAIDQGDVQDGLLAFSTLIETPPNALNQET